MGFQSGAIASLFCTGGNSEEKGFYGILKVLYTDGKMILCTVDSHMDRKYSMSSTGD